MQPVCPRGTIASLSSHNGLTTPSEARRSQNSHSTQHSRHHPSHHSHSESPSRAPASPPNLLKTTRLHSQSRAQRAGCAHVGSLERGDDGRGSVLATQRTQSQRYELSWLCEEEKQQSSMGPNSRGGGVGGHPSLGDGCWRWVPRPGQRKRTSHSHSGFWRTKHRQVMWHRHRHRHRIHPVRGTPRALSIA
jgi:hypothetical protein